MGAQPFYPIPTAILVVSFFLALVGLGDIRRLKDYVIPISIMSIGVLGSFITWLSGSELLLGTYFGILFFPLALMAPFAAKFFVENIWKD